MPCQSESFGSHSLGESGIGEVGLHRPGSLEESASGDKLSAPALALIKAPFQSSAGCLSSLYWKWLYP